MKKLTATSLLITLDLLTLIAGGYLTQLIKHYTTNQPLIAAPLHQSPQSLIILITIMILITREHIYTQKYDFWQETQKITHALLIAYLLTLATYALAQLPHTITIGWITLYFALQLLLLPTTKRLTKNLLYNHLHLKENIRIIHQADHKEQANTLKTELNQNWYLGMQSNDHTYDQIIILSQGYPIPQMNQTIDKHLKTNRRVHIIPYITDINLTNANIIEYTNIRTNTIQIQNKLLNPKNRWTKQLTEYTLTLLSLPLTLPLMLIISLALKTTTQHNILYKQQRLGKNGTPFTCYKFTTMHTGQTAQTLLDQHIKQHPEEISHYHKYHKYQADPRITPLGKILRTTSLDELPQIINVLKGQMSLVGPRPYMLSEAKKLGAHKHLILKVKPGITGLWQVSGRNNLTFQQRTQLETWYIKNWTLWSDLIILIKTLKVITHKKGAK